LNLLLQGSIKKDTGFSNGKTNFAFDGDHQERSDSVTSSTQSEKVSIKILFVSVFYL
jgi:serine/threonine protein kinase HipA of HipAB toxin-antitoxin module